MSFFSELKRRNVFKMGAAYGLLGWLVIEMASTILPTFDAPRWVVQTITFLVLLGFPIALFLAWAFELTPEGIRTEASAHTPEALSKAKGQRLNYLIFSLMGLALGFLFVDRFVLDGAVQREAFVLDPRARVERVSVTLPENRPLLIYGNPSRAIAISPDGTQLVYVARNRDLPGVVTQLQLRSLDSLAVRDLPGTTGFPQQPFFSPDGQWIAFFTTNGELKKVSLAGGSAITLAEQINGSSFAVGVWTQDDNIIFGTFSAGGLQQVSAEGGEVTAFTLLDNELFHQFPVLVPTQPAVLFASNNRVAAIQLNSGARHLVLENAIPLAVLASGHLLFQRDSTVLVAPFDLEQLTVTGSAVPLADSIAFDTLASAIFIAEVAVSANGTFAYVPADNTMAELGLVTRDGSFEPLALATNNFLRPRVAPDGRSVAFLAGPNSNDVYVFDLLRGSTTRLTQGDEASWGFAWHPNSLALAISRQLGAQPGGIYRKELSGAESPPLVAQVGTTLVRNAAWSPDGTQLAYTVQDGTQHDIWILTPGDMPVNQPLLNSVASEHSPAFSPDGGYLAYVSNESGRAEIRVQQYPQGERFAVSIDGGSGPVWSRDGSELYFQGNSGGVQKMMAVAVTQTGGSLQFARPEPLFDLDVPGAKGSILKYFPSGNAATGYDILPDGRFLMVRKESTDIREIVLVQNWFEEVSRLAPVEK